MAAQAWTIYNSFKSHMGSGIFDLDGDIFHMHLMQSGSDSYANLTLSSYGSLASEVASNATGYTQSGKLVSGNTWSLGDSASEFRFDSTALIWTGTGGTIPNIKAAVIVHRTQASSKAASNKLVCYASLTSTQFTLGSGNTLTITPSANGIFELN